MTIKLIYSKMYVDEKSSYNKKEIHLICNVRCSLYKVFFKENTVSQVDSVFLGIILLKLLMNVIMNMDKIINVNER